MYVQVQTLTNIQLQQKKRNNNGFKQVVANKICDKVKFILYVNLLYIYFIYHFVMYEYNLKATFYNITIITAQSSKKNVMP